MQSGARTETGTGKVEADTVLACFTKSPPSQGSRQQVSASDLFFDVIACYMPVSDQLSVVTSKPADWLCRLAPAQQQHMLVGCSSANRQPPPQSHPHPAHMQLKSPAAPLPWTSGVPLDIASL